jgi:hypothetical protein
MTASAGEQLDHIQSFAEARVRRFITILLMVGPEPSVSL